jgi:branched-subunit amino acid transport protein
MTTWLAVTAVAIGTYVIRAGMFVGLAGRQLSQNVQGWLALAGPAAIATLVVGAIAPAGSGVSLPPLLAGAAAFTAVRRSGNVTHAFVAGMPVFWVCSALGAAA